jgi:hypothetical protein
MDDGNEIPANAYMVAESEPQVGVSIPAPRLGLNPIAAVLVALWYSLTAAGAMSSGFHFLYEHSQNDYFLAQNLMWTVGIGIGIAIAVCLARSSAALVGGISSLLMSGLLLSLLLLGAGEGGSDVSILGFRPSPTQFLVAIAALTLLSGLLGTIAGKAMRDDESLAGPILGIRGGHWFWLWLAVYAWVAILPTGIYYFWLEIISTGYVLIHPSLWLGEAWTEGWTLTFGFMGLAATVYGVQTSIFNVSAACSSEVRTRKRVLQFLLGTLILAGPVANILFRIAIHSLKHLPDGITNNPWWILR